MQLADFFDNFEVLAAAPGGVARLREAVLSLAVRGRLVAQDLGDEPASVLLERIAAERSRLIQKKQIKPSKPLRDINLTIPPLAEQKRIVATVDRLMAHCDRLQTQLQTRSDRARALLHSAIHPLSPTA